MRTAIILLFLFCFSSCDPVAEEQSAENQDTVAADSVDVNAQAVDMNCLNSVLLKTEKLGNSGYTLQVPFGFSVIADNDSSYRVLAPFIYGENVSSIEFRKQPRIKIPGNQDKYKTFRDMICDTSIEAVSFEAIDYSFVNADVPAKTAWISIRGGVKCDDAKIEKLELDTLYSILRTVKLEK